MTPHIDFCGETAPIDRQPFTIGRDADLVLDDGNRHLHRQFLSVTQQQGVWLLANVGSQLTATVSDAAGDSRRSSRPEQCCRSCSNDTVVRFTAGPTTYEFSIHMPDPAFALPQPSRRTQGDTTVGRVAMTPDQLRLIVAIAEPALRGDGRAATTLPSNQEVARRLGLAPDPRQSQARQRLPEARRPGHPRPARGTGTTGVEPSGAAGRVRAGRAHGESRRLALARPQLDWWSMTSRKLLDV